MALAPDRQRARLREHHDERFQHELKEMQETDDLRQIDDDVEAVATLLEWRAMEHHRQPKSARWFVILAVATTIAAGIFILMANFIAVITIALAGGLLYFIAQKDPGELRYRLMVDGIAINNTLYHYKDVAAFNVVYQPPETKIVLLRSKRRLAPLLHLELGDTDPLPVRDILLEFLPEDTDLEEPIVDILARRLGV
jgi:hypothetical protein